MAEPKQKPGSARPATAVGAALVLTGVAATLAMLYYLSTILVPLVVAFVLAVLVSAVVRYIHRWWSAAPDWLVSILAAIVIITVAAAAIYALVQGTMQVVAQGPALAARIDELLVSLGQSLGLERPLHVTEVIGDISAPKLAGSILAQMQGVGTGLLLTIVYFGFMLAGRARILRKIDRAAGSSRRAAAIKSTFGRIAQDIQTYIWVQTIIGIILTTATTLVMLAVGLDNVLFWAVIFFLLTFIPNIGVTIGSVAPSLFALIQFPTPWPAVTIFVSVQVVATIVGNLIYPRLQAQTQNIDPLAVLLALSLWTLLWGLPGAFLAVPMTLMIMKVLAQFDSSRWVAAALSNDGNVGTVAKR